MRSMRVWYNSSLESKNYMVPGLIAVILQIIASLLTSLTIAREWEMGTMEQILSTPLRPAEMVLGKMFAYFAVGLADAAIAVVVGLFVFHVPFHGSVLVLAGRLAYFCSALCFGASSSRPRHGTSCRLTRSACWFLSAGVCSSGFIYAIDTMPKPIQVITHLVPARYFVTILKDVFLKGVGIRVLWNELGFLSLYAALMFLLAVRKLNQKVA